MTWNMGPAPCHRCGVHVWVERRPVVIAGHDCNNRTRAGHPYCASSPSSELREVVVTDATLARHLCAVAA
jgi:hypothetical protein